MGLGFLIVAGAPDVRVLTAGLLVRGAAAGVYRPAGLTLISRGARRRGTVFACHGAAGNVGVAIGPLLAAVLLTVLGWRPSSCPRPPSSPSSRVGPRGAASRRTTDRRPTDPY